MPFPVTLGSEQANTPAELAGFVVRDTRAGGGTVVADLPPAAWIADLVRSGALSQDEGVALAAALLQAGRADTVATGAALAERLADPRLGPLLVAAVDAVDVSSLLQVDPTDPARSVEDVLLRAAAAVADTRDGPVRRRLLERLRNAGLSGAEVTVLCRHGEADELERWLPAVFAEGLPPEAIPALAERLLADDAGAAVLRTALDSLDADTRNAVLAAGTPRGQA